MFALNFMLLEVMLQVVWGARFHFNCLSDIQNSVLQNTYQVKFYEKRNMSSKNESIIITMKVSFTEKKCNLEKCNLR